MKLIILGPPPSGVSPERFIKFLQEQMMEPTKVSPNKDITKDTPKSVKDVKKENPKVEKKTQDPRVKHLTPLEEYLKKLDTGKKILVSLYHKGIDLRALVYHNPLLARELFLREVAIRLDQSYFGKVQEAPIAWAFQNFRSKTTPTQAIPSSPYVISQLTGLFRTQFDAEQALRDWNKLEPLIVKGIHLESIPINHIYGHY